MNICSNTKFLFFITSSRKVEDRFLYDAELCIKIVLSKGVSATNIIVATDADFDIILTKWPAMNGIGLITSQQIISTISALNCENLIVVTDCHGSIRGIDAQHPIMPYPLTEALKNNPSFKNILVLFGQCYAGIYNFVDIKHDNKNIVYIGATGFDSSISYALKNIPWCANISVVAFFNWLIKPVDIDGDGCLTVMDLYKYIAWYTNSLTNEIEKSQTSHLIDAKVEIKLAMQQEQGRSMDAMKQLEKEAIEAFENYMVPHQTPWLLNAFSAQLIQFE